MKKDLLFRVREFDLEALAEVYDQYSPGVYRYALRLLGDAELAEDCTSETFNRFLVAIKHGGGPEDFLQAYLYRIAHNWINDYYRRGPPPPLDLNDELRSDEEDLTETADREIDCAKVRAALALLTPEQRQVVALKFIEGWENEAVARLLNKPVSAIKGLQHRALGTLRRLLLPREETV